MGTYEPMMTAIFDDTGAVDVLKISGDLAWDTVGLLDDAKAILAMREGVPLVIDLSDLEFIDSKGIGFLLEMRFAFVNKPVSLAGVPSVIRKVFERTCVMNRFFVFKSVSEAEALAKAYLMSA